MKPQKDAAYTSLHLSDKSLSGLQTPVSSAPTFGGVLSILPVFCSACTYIAFTVLSHCAIQVCRPDPGNLDQNLRVE